MSAVQPVKVEADPRHVMAILELYVACLKHLGAKPSAARLRRTRRFLPVLAGHIIRNQYDAGHSVRDIARFFRVSKSTVYSYLKAQKERIA